VGGFRVGENTYLRLGVAAEAGYDTNVFYSDQNKVDSATLRVTPSIELTNANRDGTTPTMHYSLAASLLYREYLKDDPTVREQRAFNPVVSGSLGYNPVPASPSRFPISSCGWKNLPMCRAPSRSPGTTTRRRGRWASPPAAGASRPCFATPTAWTCTRPTAWNTPTTWAMTS
jgi:hypothetical protein